MRELTAQEIDELASRPKCNKDAIRSFLNELKNETSPGMFGVIQKARDYAYKKGLNKESSDALAAGVRLAYEGK